MAYKSGRHFLQIPGPSPVPDRILRAMDMPVIDHRGPEFGELGARVLEKLKAVFKTEEQYRRGSASRQSLQTKRRHEASSRLLQRLSNRDGRKVSQSTESLTDSDEEEQVPSRTESVVATAMAAEARHSGESKIREALMQARMEVAKNRLLERLKSRR